jgi:hypothetical protein
MKNKLTDLNNHLFAQMERLNSEDLKGENLKYEVERAKAMAEVASHIVGAAKVTVDAMRLVAKGDVRKEDLPLLISN